MIDNDLVSVVYEVVAKTHLRVGLHRIAVMCVPSSHLKVRRALYSLSTSLLTNLLSGNGSSPVLCVSMVESPHSR